MNPSEVGPFVSKIRAVINEIGKLNYTPFGMLQMTSNVRLRRLHVVFICTLWPKYLRN